jgi:hypothetical protein
MTGRASLMVPIAMTGCLVLASCAASQKGERVRPAPTGMHEITALYEKAMQYHPQEVRKPVRDEQARYLRLLAEKTDAFLGETRSWDSDAHLTSVAPSDRDSARDKVRSFRESLKGLKTAAEEADASAVPARYRAVMHSYRELAAAVHVAP